MMTPSQRLQQMNVDKDPSVNERLNNKERLHNLEADIIIIGNTMEQLVVQNNKYTEYLDVQMKAKKDSSEFWMDVKKKLASSAIWGTIVLIFTAIVYAVKQWIANH